MRNQVGIPEWIKSNPKYFIACIRGLIDTDGYLGKYLKRKGKYTYFQYHVGFTNHSIKLLEDFISFCDQFDIPVARTSKFKAIIGSKKGVLKFLKITKPFKLTKANFTLDELM